MCGVRRWVCQTGVVWVHVNFQGRGNGDNNRGHAAHGRHRGGRVGQSERKSSGVFTEVLNDKKMFKELYRGKII